MNDFVFVPLMLLAFDCGGRAGRERLQQQVHVNAPVAHMPAPMRCVTDASAVRRRRKGWVWMFRSTSFELSRVSRVLFLDAMENALKEFANGVRVNIKFTKEKYGPRYDHHRLALESLQQKSPVWFATFSHELYSKISTHQLCAPQECCRRAR
ncbi:hypothetical protein MVEN_00036900 [Mycena venus]|uniref:DUF6532 domain-containing protein n=1 Tax=Mycena venus TaxID=2733690 RepID=A0A8H7DG20_9AGAR|nr:hypothetical protein MVEN_00036900 [Mycena venus]